MSPQPHTASPPQGLLPHRPPPHPIHLRFCPNHKKMTYCVAIKLNAGLVFLSDSRDQRRAWTRSAPSAK